MMSSLSAQLGVVLDGRAERLTVHVRHHHVEDHDAVGVALGRAAARSASSAGRGPVHLGVPAAPGVEHAGDDPAVGRVVVDREHAHARRRRPARRRSSAASSDRGVLLREAAVNQKVEPDAGLALDADLRRP